MFEFFVFAKQPHLGSHLAPNFDQNMESRSRNQLPRGPYDLSMLEEIQHQRNQTHTENVIKDPQLEEELPNEVAVVKKRGQIPYGDEKFDPELTRIKNKIEVVENGSVLLHAIGGTFSGKQISNTYYYLL